MDFTPRETDKTLSEDDNVDTTTAADNDSTDDTTTVETDGPTLEDRVATLEREVKSLRRKQSAQTRDYDSMSGTLELLQDSAFGVGVRKSLADIEEVRELEDAEAERNAR